MVRENEWARVENTKVTRTNVLSFDLVLNEEKRFFAVGCYFAPSDKEGGGRGWWIRPCGTNPWAPCPS